MSKSKSSLALDLNLPVLEVPQVEHWPSPMSWSDAMRHFATSRERCMREHHSLAIAVGAHQKAKS